MSAVTEVMERKDRPPFVRFERRPIEDKVAGLKEGRYVGRDVDYALVTAPYSKDIFIQPVDEWMQNLLNEVQAERFPKSWFDRFREDYNKWKAGEEMPLRGTPIRGWLALSPAQQEMLIRMNVLTVEDLAIINDEGIQRIGPGGIELKYKAQAALQAANSTGPLVMENAHLKVSVSNLSTEVETLKGQVEKLLNAQNNDRTATVVPAITASDLLEEPTHDELVAAYTAKHGKPPHHRMADRTIAEALK